MNDNGNRVVGGPFDGMPKNKAMEFLGGKLEYTITMFANELRNLAFLYETIGEKDKADELNKQADEMDNK